MSLIAEISNEFQLEEEQDVDIVDDYYSEHINKEVEGYLCSFFPDRKFNMDVCLDLVSNTLVEEAVPLAYEIMGVNVGVVLKVFRDCGMHKIPKKYHGGILLIYLKLCMGLEIPQCKKILN